jgi:subtilisin family serine protease
MRARLMNEPVGDSDEMPIVIELNVGYKGGSDTYAAISTDVVKGAYEALLRLFQELGLPRSGGEPPLFDDYVPTIMSMNDIQRLVEKDAHNRDFAERAIFRIWPDFTVHPQIDASGRTVKADAARQSFNARGADIRWAVVDSGVDADHPHFQEGNTLRGEDVKDLHRDFTDTLTPDETTIESALRDGHENNHGTRVASIIAGYLPENFKGKVEVVTEQVTGADDTGSISAERKVRPEALTGMAPDAHIVSLKVLDNKDPSPPSMIRVMAALRYVRQLNGDNDKVTRIHGVNLSLGYEFDPQWFACGKSPLCKEVDRLVRSGVVVVVAAGNTGYAEFNSWERTTSAGLVMSINDPGNADRAITVGSTHRQSPHTYGVSYFSSKGPTGDGRLKPDLLAPGERITSASKRVGADAIDPEIASYTDESGTSFAAPHVSGAIAAFLSVRQEFITCPERIKEIFVGSAVTLGREATFQGAGLVDLMRALQSV